MRIVDCRARRVSGADTGVARMRSAGRCAYPWPTSRPRVRPAKPIPIAISQEEQPDEEGDERRRGERQGPGPLAGRGHGGFVGLIGAAGQRHHDEQPENP